jgi:hypothetical protein
MKSPNITEGRQEKTSAAWFMGANSVRNPWALPENQYKWGVNVTCRGGMVQTRPGYTMKLSLPAGNFQGGVVFNANKQAQSSLVITGYGGSGETYRNTIYDYNGNAVEAEELPYVVFAVDGKVYFLPFPLVQPTSWENHRLTGIEMNPDADKINFVIATRSATISTGGGVAVTPSHRLIIIQDGSNTPCYWDGSNDTGNLAENMPIGYWMAYSGNRLWVANGNIISASDLANPIGWEERKTGSGRGDFSVPRKITALQDYVGQNNETSLYVFTDQSTYSIASGILDRNAWANTANFQSNIFPHIGCVAGKSISFQAGQMWWYSQGGLVSVDVASASYLSSQILFKDIEMAKAKRLMPSDYTGICATSFENYILYSIPYLEKLNSVTMVLDYAVASEWNQNKIPAWSGVWTGIRPVEWATGMINNQPKLFAFSVDYSPSSDGSYNHLWEAFTPEREDKYFEINQDGSTTERVNRIYCQFETGLLGDTMDLKQLVYGEVDCSQIAGTVDVKVSFRGTKGKYQSILDKRILAVTEKYQYENTSAQEEIKDLGILQTQARRLVTENIGGKNDKSSCESDYSNDVDKCFSFLIEWCGAFGVDSVRMYLDPWPDKSIGRKSENETVYCAVGENGDSKTFNLQTAPVEKAPDGVNSWKSTQTRTVTLRCNGGSTVPAVSSTATASYISYVSESDAVTQAALIATQEATTAANLYRKSNPC